MAKNLSSVTERVIKTDPTLPIWANPYLFMREMRSMNLMVKSLINLETYPMGMICGNK